MYQMPGSHIIPYKGVTPITKRGVFLASGAQIIGDLVIEEDTSIWFNTVVRADCHWIRIGARTNIQDGCVVHVSQGTFPTSIGNDVTIGHGAIIHGCTIGDGSLVGMGAIVLDGATISPNCFVAAGAVVTPGKTFPPGSMIIGTPARAVRPLKPEEIEGLRRSVDYYLDYKRHYESPGT